jgi:hypothetical protein
VYQKLLHFYKAAYDLLTKRGPKLIIQIVLETGHLPTIVQDFLVQANVLQATIQNATADILAEIESMLYKTEGKSHQPFSRRCSYLLQSRIGWVVTSSAARVNMMLPYVTFVLTELAGSYWTTPGSSNGTTHRVPNN